MANVYVNGAVYTDIDSVELVDATNTDKYDVFKLRGRKDGEYRLSLLSGSYTNRRGASIAVSGGNHVEIHTTADNITRWSIYSVLDKVCGESATDRASTKQEETLFTVSEGDSITINLKMSQESTGSFYFVFQYAGATTELSSGMGLVNSGTTKEIERTVNVTAEQAGDIGGIIIAPSTNSATMVLNLSMDIEMYINGERVI